MRTVHLVYCITRSDTIGGGHIHILDLAEWMQRQGANVHILAGGHGLFHDWLAARGLPGTPLRNLQWAIHPHRDTAAAWEMARILRRLRPDLLSLHASKAGLLGRLIRPAVRAPVIFTAHGWSFTDGVSPRAARWYRHAERLAAPLATRIITVSEYDRQLALRHRIAAPRRLVTIANGIRPARARAAPDQAGTPRIACVARLEPQKDHETLLHALAGLRGHPWRLELIGDGPLRAPLLQQAQALGIAERIQFTGLCDDVPARLATAQLFVLPSRWEGLPRSVLEAMSAGLPVIASDVGGTAEAVRHGETGYLVPRGDIERWQAYLGALLIHQDQRKAMGQQGRRRFEQRFSLERMARETSRIYEEALGGSRRPTAARGTR